MNLFLQLLVGSFMIGITVVIHAITLDFMIKRVGYIENCVRRVLKSFWKPIMAGMIVVSVFIVNVIHIWLWAFLYLVLECPPINNLPDALYFSTVTYTTVGYGDITLDSSFRMLSGIESANGFLLFGWTTAFILEVISQLYKREAHSI